MQSYSVLRTSGQLAMRGMDLAISSRLTGLVTATALAFLVGGFELNLSKDEKLFWFWPRWLPDELTVGAAVLYAGVLASMGTGLGRYPLSGRLVAYSAMQAFVVVADGYVLGRIATKPDHAGQNIFLYSDHNCRVRWLTFPPVVIWFGCRLLDGWYRASMPIDTLPFASLVSKTRLGNFMSPLLGRIPTWGGAAALAAKMIRWSLAVGQLAMKGADLLISSRLTWLVSGIATTYPMGMNRARELQERRRQKIRSCGNFHEPPVCPDTVERCVVGFNSDEHSFCTQESCKRAHTEQQNGGHYHAIQCRVVTWKSESSLSLRQWLMSGKVSAGLLAAYGGVLLLAATAGGRVALSGRSMTYWASQVGMKWLDSVVYAKCFIGRFGCDDKGKTKFSHDQTYYASTAWVAAGLYYFGVRLADGYMMASMPINTAPGLSLAAQLCS
jgi:hypothetical protein